MAEVAAAKGRKQFLKNWIGVGAVVVLLCVKWVLYVTSDWGSEKQANRNQIEC